MLLPEYAEMLSALSAEGAEYVVVGGFAVGIHLQPRATKDLDILVRPSLANAKRVHRALAAFGAALFGVKAADFSRADLVFQIGVAPRRIDILTSITGLTFAEAWRTRVEVVIRGVAAPVPFLGRDALLRNKRAVGRPQDLVDAAGLATAPDTRSPAKKAPRRIKR